MIFNGDHSEAYIPMQKNTKGKKKGENINYKVNGIRIPVCVLDSTTNRHHHRYRPRYRHHHRYCPRYRRHHDD